MLGVLCAKQRQSFERKNHGKGKGKKKTTIKPMRSPLSEISMESRVEDRISGMIGWVTARYVFLTGCVQYQVTPEQGTGEKPEGEQWIDTQRLIVLKEGAGLDTNAEDGPSGPHSPPPARSGPWPATDSVG